MPIGGGVAALPILDQLRQIKGINDMDEETVGLLGEYLRDYKETGEESDWASARRIMMEAGVGNIAISNIYEAAQ